jgi:hypothetical protein
MSAELFVGNRNYSSWSIRGSLVVRQNGRVPPSPAARCFADAVWGWPALQCLAAEATAKPRAI